MVSAALCYGGAMNERFVHSFSNQPATTQAAEGMLRRAWTITEIEAMQRAGIIDEDERFELIGGEVVPMQAKGGRHEIVKVELNWHFQTTASRELWVAPETTLRLDERTFLEPDFCVYPRSVFPGDLRGHHVLLAIEVADTSLAYDRGRKIGVYAAFGIPEVWVIDANTLVTRVHRQLGAEGFRTVFEAQPSEEIVAQRADSVAMCLERLGLKPLS
ncbi:Uma2 family endonuclease [Chelativorans sp.]|uniref:Uma2 family endonuclease n=1 Tax=Chelativorans sp. TaxID=2203393 RepID=UPI0028127BEF|nr:Uma2 family endonuclease [Chelativorans sp.]